MTDKDELATAIQTAAVKIRTAFVEHYPLGTPLDVFETIIHEALDPIFARQQARSNELEELALEAWPAMERYKDLMSEEQDGRLRWEAAVDWFRRARTLLSPRTEAENG